MNPFAKILWSQTRNIMVMAEPKVVRYIIPMYSDNGLLGMIKSVKVENSTIEIVFHKKQNKNVDVE